MRPGKCRTARFRPSQNPDRAASRTGIVSSSTGGGEKPRHGFSSTKSRDRHLKPRLMTENKGCTSLPRRGRVGRCPRSRITVQARQPHLVAALLRKPHKRTLQTISPEGVLGATFVGRPAALVAARKDGPCGSGAGGCSAIQRSGKTAR